MQAAGGLDYVVELAEALLRRNPKRITLLAPLVTYVLIFASGTQHVIYALLPVIAEVSRKAGVRPERPLSISVIAAQHGLDRVADLGGDGGARERARRLGGRPAADPARDDPGDARRRRSRARSSVAFRGAELADDPGVPRARRRGPDRRARGDAARLEGPARRRAIGACVIFLAAIWRSSSSGLPGAAARFERASTARRDGRVDMGRAIMIVMLAAGGRAAPRSCGADPEQAAARAAS